MSITVNFSEIFEYGTLKDGILVIKDSFSFTKKREGGSDQVRISVLSSYEGASAPRIQLDIYVPPHEKRLYTSPDYAMAKYCEYSRKEWRTPPMFLPEMTLTVRVTVPEGTTLYLRDFAARADNFVKDYTRMGLRHNSHLGFYGIAPNNTMPAFELAAESGYPTCIVVPKVTKDGVIVCIHDDTINATARDENGNPPTEPIYVKDMTYDELLKWDYGRYFHPIYKGTKIPKLSEFFDLCMKTGMRPMFSTHPGLTREQWIEVKGMLSERGLLEGFHIKSFELNILALAYSVFGTEIDGYTFDCNKCEPELIEKLLAIGIDSTKCRLVYEHPFSYYTEEKAKMIISAGISPAAYSVKVRASEDYIRLIGWGVKEYTEDNHCSFGLNW